MEKAEKPANGFLIEGEYHHFEEMNTDAQPPYVPGHTEKQ